MTIDERRGLELILRHPAPLGGYSNDSKRAARLAEEWIVRQLDLDTKRRKPRGKYRGILR